MTIFSKIIEGQIPCYEVGQDADNFAFLDINPLVKGHTLVVPKMEVDKLFDLPADRLQSLITFAQRVAKNIEKNIDCKRVGVVVLGLDVAHAHIHLIPLNDASDIDFSRKKLVLTPAEFSQIAASISLL